MRKALSTMAFINLYKPPTPEKQSLSTLQEDGLYDINFAFRLPAILETSRVKLIPFIPSRHAQPFFDATRGHNLFHHIPFLLTTIEEFLEFVEWIRSQSIAILMLIIDKTKADLNHDLGGSMAGIIGLLHTSERNLSTEIGPVVILPAFQHTHVSSNAIGLMVHYCFDLPIVGGLGFRRVQWTANPTNLASVKVAEKIGFVHEGTMRWTWVLPEGKEGKMARVGDPLGRLGRDSVLLAVCWEDWEGGARERVDELMQRV